MTTASRMREALADVQEEIDYLSSMKRTEFGDGHLCGLEKAKKLMIEALSPPARRTSYEWEFPGDSTKYSVRWGSEGQWSIWAMNWRSLEEFEECGFGEFAFAIATLANLTPPEEKA